LILHQNNLFFKKTAPGSKKWWRGLFVYGKMNNGLCYVMDNINALVGESS